MNSTSDTDLSMESTSASPEGRLFVLSGPSGVGKDSLLDALFAGLPGITRSVSATTRLPRDGEVEGRDYFFLSPDQFIADIEAGHFLEYARYGDHFYGTPHAGVDAKRAAGIDVILKIDVQGALAIRQSVVRAVLIFVLPPSAKELERRLRTRNTETPEKIAQRLQIASRELSCSSLYDYQVVNDRFETALDALRSIVIAERHRVVP